MTTPDCVIEVSTDGFKPNKHDTFRGKPVTFVVRGALPGQSVKFHAPAGLFGPDKQCHHSAPCVLTVDENAEYGPYTLTLCPRLTGCGNSGDGQINVGSGHGGGHDD
jgi:hypothetical protein